MELHKPKRGHTAAIKAFMGPENPRHTRYITPITPLPMAALLEPPASYLAHRVTTSRQPVI